MTGHIGKTTLLDKVLLVVLVVWYVVTFRGRRRPGQHSGN